MDIYSIYKPIPPPLEKDSPLFHHSYKQPDLPPSKNPSFLRQSTNSMENYFGGQASNPFISEKTNSIPELKDLAQERALSRLKSRASSNSKSPKNNLNFNGNAPQQGTFLKDLENQWKNLKEDHHNFIPKNDKEKKASFINNIHDRDERSVSPARQMNFNNNPR